MSFGEVKPFVTVKHPNGDRREYRISMMHTVQSLKQMIFERTKIPTAQQRLMFVGIEIEDHLRLSNYNVVNGSTLYLV